MGVKLDMIGITSANMAESIRFYRLLGLDFPDPEGPYVETTIEGGARVSINDLEMVKGIDPTWQEAQGQRVGLAFLCDGPEGVDAKYKEILDAGFKGHKEPWDAFWGQRYAIVTDPDGNHVDLFAPLE